MGVTARAGITGCVVARDESPLIDECLSQLQQVVDALIVVDHGSSDDTAQRAHARGATVLRAKHEHHEQARNEYLEAVTTPWVLVLDADERISAEAVALRSATRDAPDDVLGFSLERYDYTGRGRFAETPLVRLFRSHPEIRYFRSRAHASVMPSIEALGGRVVPLHAPLHHLDALLPGRHERKRTRMIDRLRAELADGGLAVMHCFLALELFALGETEEASRELSIAVEQNSKCEPMARLFRAQQALRLGDVETAEAHARWVIDAAPAYRGRSGAFTVLAEVLTLREERLEAISVLRRAVAEVPWSAAHHLSLATLLDALDIGEARTHLALACRRNPWLGDARIEVAGSPSIFTQQEAMLSTMPRFSELASRLQWSVP